MRSARPLLVALLLLARPAWADNPMGYRLLTAQEAAGLPRGGGTLGLVVERAQQVTSGGLTFDILRVSQVRPGSAAAQAGLSAGEQVIAVDGRVFPTIAAFAAYVGAQAPGTHLAIDTMPAGGGPQQAQRVIVVMGGAARGAATPQQQSQQQTVVPQQEGMSTGTKLEIAGAAIALFGCYERGCFSRHQSAPQQQPTQQPR